jgi:hypothetical protein
MRLSSTVVGACSIPIFDLIAARCGHLMAGIFIDNVPSLFTS